MLSWQLIGQNTTSSENIGGGEEKKDLKSENEN